MRPGRQPGHRRPTVAASATMPTSTGRLRPSSSAWTSTWIIGAAGGKARGEAVAKALAHAGAEPDRRGRHAWRRFGRAARTTRRRFVFGHEAAGHRVGRDRDAQCREAAQRGAGAGTREAPVPAMTSGRLAAAMRSRQRVGKVCGSGCGLGAWASPGVSSGAPGSTGWPRGNPAGTANTTGPGRPDECAATRGVEVLAEAFGGMRTVRAHLVMPRTRVEFVVVDLVFGFGPGIGFATDQNHHGRTGLEGRGNAGDGVGHALVDVDHGDADLAGDPAIAVGGADGGRFVAAGDDGTRWFLSSSSSRTVCEAPAKRKDGAHAVALQHAGHHLGAGEAVGVGGHGAGR